MSIATGTSWRELDTPQLVVDRDKMLANIRAFHPEVLSHGTALRAHVKTHKTPEIAKIQIGEGAVGIAAAKISEAEVFVEAGIGDVVVAYPVYGERKFDRLAKLARNCDRLAVHAENPEAIEGLSRAAAALGVSLGIRVEIDSGFHRTGVDSAGALTLARQVEQLPGLWLDGVTSHRSMFFPDAGDRDPHVLGVEEGEFMVEVADRIRSAGLEVEHVVAGSTPTSRSVATVDGITEVCAGTYVFYDVGMADLGVTDWSSIALSAVSTVVVAHTGSQTYTIDAGAKTLTKDSYPGDGPRLFGRRLDNHDDVLAVTDEHGIVEANSVRPRLGDVVRIAPMHVCPTVNLADELAVITGDAVVDVWPVAARGRTK